MNAAAAEVVRQFVDVVVAYGQSDEYRYVFFVHVTLVTGVSFHFWSWL